MSILSKCVWPNWRVWNCLKGKNFFNLMGVNIYEGWEGGEGRRRGQLKFCSPLRSPYKYNLRIFLGLVTDSMVASQKYGRSMYHISGWKVVVFDDAPFVFSSTCFSFFRRNRMPYNVSFNFGIFLFISLF